MLLCWALYFISFLFCLKPVTYQRLDALGVSPNDLKIVLIFSFSLVFKTRFLILLNSLY